MIGIKHPRNTTLPGRYWAVTEYTYMISNLVLRARGKHYKWMYHA